MSLAIQSQMSSDAFLAWEEQQVDRWEFDGIAPVAMTGGSFAHSAICGNLITALNIRLRGQPCRPGGPDLKIATAHGYRYPDALITCAAVPPGALVAPDPVVLFEVLSPNTALTDLITKLAEYRAIPSVQHYVILEQVRPAATLYLRAGPVWTVQQLGAAETLALPSVALEIPLSELYADLVFPLPTPNPDER